MTKEREQYFVNSLRGVLPGLKENPNKYPIIDKWNSRIWHKGAVAAFHIIEDAIEEELNEMFATALQEQFDEFVETYNMRMGL